MDDRKCWMIDNLKYTGPTDSTGTPIPNYNPDTGDYTGTVGITYRNGRGPNIPTTGTNTYNTIDGSTTQSATNSDKAFYNNPMSSSYCYGTTNLPPNTLTNCGYLYNWYAATAGTGLYNTSTQGTNVQNSICPANFRLPSGTSNGSTPTSNGTSPTASDLPVLNASMNAGTLTSGATTSSFYANWQPSGSWSGAFSGYWSTGLSSQGSYGYYWSSTAYSATNARGLNFNSSIVSPGNNFVKYSGLSVCCLIQ